MLAKAAPQIHFGELLPRLERQREFLHSLVFSFDHLAISQLLPLLGDGKTEKCPGRSLQHLHIAIFTPKGCKPKIYFLRTFYDWSNVLDASQATLAMAGARKDGKNARTEACLACAGPCVATGLIWPLGLAWVGSLWPDLPAWVCESYFMLLTGPLTCLTITLDRHHNPMFALLTKGCKEIQRHVHIFNR